MNFDFSYVEMVVDVGSSIKAAVKLLSEYSHGIVYVLDRDSRLVGTISDGDVRKAILNEIPMTEPIETIMNSSFVYAEEHTNEHDVALLMRLKKVLQVPVIDSDRKLIGSIDGRTISQLDLGVSGSVIKNTFVIMAGGLGTRLLPLTENLPKPLITLGGKPMIQYLLDTAIRQGFKNFVACLNYRAEQIQCYLEKQVKGDCSIRCIVENDRCGTAGALYLCEEFLSENFVVANADVLTKADIREMLRTHEASRCLITVGATSKEMQVDFGVLDTHDGFLTGIIEKPSYTFLVNAGIYIVNKQLLLDYPKRGFVDMTDLIEYALNLNESRAVKVFPLFESWLDVGTHSALEVAQRQVMSL